MKTSKAGSHKKPGRKGNKVRTHVTLSENMHAAATYIGSQTFGNTTAYLEHLILNDLQRHGITIEKLQALVARSEHLTLPELEKRVRESKE